MAKAEKVKKKTTAVKSTTKKAPAKKAVSKASSATTKVAAKKAPVKKGVDQKNSAVKTAPKKTSVQKAPAKNAARMPIAARVQGQRIPQRGKSENSIQHEIFLKVRALQKQVAKMIGNASAIAAKRLKISQEISLLQKKEAESR